MFFSVVECSDMPLMCISLGIILILLNSGFILYCAYSMWTAFVAKNQEHIQKFKEKLGSKFKKIVTNISNDVQDEYVNPLPLRGRKNSEGRNGDAIMEIEMTNGHCVLGKAGKK